MAYYRNANPQSVIRGFSVGRLRYVVQPDLNTVLAMDEHGNNAKVLDAHGVSHDLPYIRILLQDIVAAL